MKRVTCIVLAPALLVCQPTIKADRITLIENTTAIDAINGTRENVDILILDDQISKVVPASKTFKFKGTIKIIDGRGQYVLPGLWDAHVHLSYNDDIDHEVFFPLAIAHGITYLRDTGGHLEKLEEARARAASDPRMPDLYVSGPLLDGKRRIYDGSSAGFPDMSVGLATEQIARDYVDKLAAQNVSFVKAYEMLPPEIFTAIGDQAAKHNLPVAMHIPLSMTAEEAVAAGADDMQHLRNIELSCASNVETLAQMRRTQIAQDTEILPSKLRGQIHTKQRAIALPNQSEETCLALLKLLADGDVYQTPTLTISRFFTRRLFDDEAFRRTFDYMPTDIAKGWYTRSAQLKNIPTTKAGQAYDDWIIQTLPKIAEAGIPILAGTDAPIAFLTPGASLHEEIIMLSETGLSPMQTLRAATYEPARFFGLETKQGTIAAGMKADLVLLRANPLTDMNNIKQIETVIKNGNVIDRQKLDALKSLPSNLK